MSIIKREKSTIGVYHVLAQGAGNNELFHDDEDYQVFVEYLARLMKEAWAADDEPDRPYFHTYAYCLTPRQFRLIVREEKYQVSAIMQSISQLYSRYYSGKYNSYGPLYRRRYYSEPINDEERLEVLLRYVHQEPMRVHGAGLMVHDVEQNVYLDEWAWSSWHEYVGLGSDLPNESRGCGCAFSALCICGRNLCVPLSFSVKKEK